MKSTVYRGKQVQRITPKQHEAPCRVTGCDRHGYGRWCMRHTPKGGAGVLVCDTCGGRIIEHSLLRPCRDS